MEKAGARLSDFYYCIYHYTFIQCSRRLQTSKYVIGRTGNIRQKPIFGSDAVYHYMQSFTEIGIRVYKRFTYTIDVIFPLSMLLFLYTFSKFTLQRVALTKYFFKTVKLLPWIWFGFDMLENANVFYLLSEFPKQHLFVAGSLGWITVTKFVLLFLSLLLPALLLLFPKKLQKRY